MYISVDLGGTNIRIVGSRDLDNPKFISEPLRRRNTNNYENDLDYIIKSSQKIAGKATIDAVGIGITGSPNQDKTMIASAGNMSNWVGKPFIKTISESLSCPVYYDNDAVATALGEVYYGHLKTDFHYLIWGTGIGGAEVLCSSKLKVAQLEWQDHYRDWEIDCGGAKLAQNFGKPTENFSDNDWKIVINNFGKHLNTYANTYSPKTIVFAGGLSNKHAKALLRLASKIGININITNFGEDSGLWGGFGLIRYNTLMFHSLLLPL
jgi:predicted NBD/HSP70 family sugar kinase